MENTRTARRVTPLLRVAPVVLSLAIIALLVARVSSAAFSDTTDNTSNSFAAGDVILSDNDSGSAMFAVTNMAPGDGDTECIVVTYEGSLDANVKLYGAVTAGDGLETYLDVVIERGSGGTFGDCTGFSSSETVYSGTLAGFAATHTDFGSGAGTWAPSGGAPDDDMTYRVQVTLQDDNGAQGLSATASFTWEAQNT